MSFLDEDELGAAPGGPGSRRPGADRQRQLLREVWGYGEDVMSRTVDTHVAELRRKLEEDAANPKYLLTVRKTGYRLATAEGGRP